ncbi:uncharacterized protein K460DRAFT_278256, partial [Cucurbitaria berberidis CBS 394.84]
LVPDSVIKKPDINNIYFNTRRTEVSIVPRGLQLPWLFKNYNEMARIGFNATRTQDPQLMRGLWYFALDYEHSFSRYYELTRWNLIAMAYVWALDFPPELCGPDEEVHEFVLAYIGAWFAYMNDTGDHKKTSFEAQEKFIALWEGSDLDLFTIRDIKTRRGVHNLVKKLYAQPLPPSLRKVVNVAAKDIIYLRQEGQISDIDYTKYGPALILECVDTNTKLGTDVFEANHNLSVAMNNLEDLRERERAHQFARRKGGDNPLTAVDWSSEMVDSLLNAVDHTLPDPKTSIKQRRPDTTRTPWMDVDTFFGILRSGFEELKKEEESMVLGMGEVSLG